MSARAKAEHGVNRLIDIVVEEVSLVDRAANMHRFLIVKRSNEMDQTTTDATTTAADETEEVQDLAAGIDEGEPSSDTGGTASADTPLGSALAALEGLTEAVEILGTAGEDGAKPRLAELAGELHAVSDRLAGLAGAKPSGVKDDGARCGRAGHRPLAGVVASVRATLQRVSSALDAAGKDGGLGDAGGAGNDEDGKAAGGETGDSGGDGVAAQLGALATALRTLTDTVKEQQRRLGRIEKRFGLPNIIRDCGGRRVAGRRGESGE